MDPVEYMLFLLTFTALAVAALVIAAGGILYYLMNIQNLLAGRPPSRTEEDLNEDYLTNIQAMVSGHPGVPDAERAPSDIGGEVKGAESMQEHLAVLTEKHRLTSLTLASADGLSIGSTRPDPEEDAAEFSYLFLQGKQPDESGIRLFEILHNGETVIGIARSDQDLGQDEVDVIRQDAETALQKWV
ncbi:MAG: hypothetical protein KO206_06665 [Methanomicrobiaceae archaeon]|uniref:Uncharacterized protein n=1 Tax=hydrocarbon metagenome TaxID=938273 RepID=A0A0W8FGY6_9ZZZZ|nr:hypothetical protein [Methanomicrobiaceae archaeon]MDD5419776.1 hypothetical protein [Methanomicrobiaceae archaeon]